MPLQKNRRRMQVRVFGRPDEWLQGMDNESHNENR